jgi:CRP-like cAMP-binding protein
MVTKITFKNGDIIIKQGEEGTQLYIIESGRVAVFKTSKGAVEDSEFEHGVSVGK